MKKRVIAIGLACLTAGIGLAGCAGSNEQPTEATTTAETTTAAETTTTTAETTTTTQETTTATEAPTEAWMAKYADAAIPPGKDPEKVWDGVYKVELRLDNGIHIYVPSFFDSWYDGMEPHGNYGFGIHDPGDTDGYIDYSEYDENTHTSHYGKDYFELKSNEIHIGIHEGVIDIAGRISSSMPKDDDIHKYKKIAEKDGKVFYIDFMTPYYSGSGYTGWKVYDGGFDEGSDLGYYNKYADMIADTAWVEKNNNSALYGLTSHPEDDVFLDYLRQYYKTHDTSDGLPRYDEYSHYTKYAVADFNADGRNELAVEYKYDHDGYKVTNTSIYTADNLDFDDFMRADRADNYGLTDVTFLDNGVAYRTVNDRYYYANNTIDKKAYYILSDRVLEQLNYNLNNFGEGAGTFNLYYYYDENGKIMKCLAGGSEHYFDPVEKTQAEFESDMAILNSGNVMNIEIKDFTAENIGL